MGVPPKIVPLRLQSRFLTIQHKSLAHAGLGRGKADGLIALRIYPPLTLTANGVIPPQGSKSSLRRKNASIYLSKSCVCSGGSIVLDRWLGSHLRRWPS